MDAKKQAFWSLELRSHQALKVCAPSSPSVALWSLNHCFPDASSSLFKTDLLFCSLQPQLTYVA
jgi:hypothetical protein